MHQLTSLDLLFLRLENATQSGHVAGVSVLEAPAEPGGGLTLDALRDLVGGRLHLVGALRRRLVTVPLDLDRPYWIEDPDFDLGFHLRELALPAPGDDVQLAEQVARLHARPLDRSRPLWELYLIHGLAGGRQALYGKVHHAVVDGVSGGEILGILMDRTPVPRLVDPPEAPWHGEAPPAQYALLGRGLRNMARHPAEAVRTLPRLLPHLGDVPGVSLLPGTGALAGAAGRVARLRGRVAEQVADRLGDVLGANGPAGAGRTVVRVPDTAAARPELTVPRTPFNGPITAHRRFAFASVPLADVRAVRNAHGCADNDVVLAMCASALRRWLLDRGALPAGPLVVGVPVSLRRAVRPDADGGPGAARSSAGRPSAAEQAGNHLSLMVAPLPTHVADPAERLAEVAAAMFAAKRRFSAMPDGWLEDLTGLLPAALTGLASRAVSRLANGAAGPAVNLIISSVPGPPVPLYVAGSRMLAHYPVSAVSDAFGGLNMTVVRYGKNLDLGLVACREMVPDLFELAGYVTDALDELKV